MQPEQLNDLELQSESDIIYNDGEVIVYKKMIENKLHAIKRVPMEYQTKLNSQEKSICQRLKFQTNKHLIKIQKVWKNHTHYFILMEYCPVNLKTYLQKKWKYLRQNPYKIVQIILQIIYGLVELKVSHRDLKLTNILVKEESQKQIKIVLTDFGSSNKGELFNKTKTGTMFYMAPETKFVGREMNQIYNRKSDIWSLSLCVFELCAVFYNQDFRQCQRLPQMLPKFQDFLYKELDNQNSKKLENFMKDNYPIFNQKIPKLLKKLMLNTLLFDPIKRWSLMQILQYFYKNIEQLYTYFPGQANLEVEEQIVSNMSKQYLGNEKQARNFQKVRHIKTIYFQLYKALKQKPKSKLNNNYYGIPLLQYLAAKKISQEFSKLVGENIVKKSTLIEEIFSTNNNFKQLKIDIIQLKNSLCAKKTEAELNQIEISLIKNEQRMQRIVTSLRDYKFDEQQICNIIRVLYSMYP